MTNREAFAEAQKRWGKNAGVSHDPKGLLQPARDRAARQLAVLRQQGRGFVDKVFARALLITRRARCKVGIGLGIGFLAKGIGDTWEEAFTDADVRHGQKPAVAPNSDFRRNDRPVLRRHKHNHHDGRKTLTQTLKLEILQRNYLFHFVDTAIYDATAGAILAKDKGWKSAFVLLWFGENCRVDSL